VGLGGGVGSPSGHGVFSAWLEKCYVLTSSNSGFVRACRRHWPCCSAASTEAKRVTPNNLICSAAYVARGACRDSRRWTTEAGQVQGGGGEVATYRELVSRIQKTDGFVAQTCWIAQIKAKHGLIRYPAANRGPWGIKPCPPEKEAAIERALRHFSMIRNSD